MIHSLLILQASKWVNQPAPCSLASSCLSLPLFSLFSLQYLTSEVQYLWLKQQQFQDDILAQFRHLLYMFDCSASCGSQSGGLKVSCYSEFGRKWPEIKASLCSGSGTLCDSSIMVKPNWPDYFSIVSLGARGSNNKCLACVPSRRG